MKSLLTIIILGLNLNLFAVDPSSPEKENLETFSVSGKVIENNSGESLTGAIVEVLGTDISVYSNFDGEFEINGLKPGFDYTLRISYVSFKNKIIRGINSSEGEIIIKLLNENVPQKNSAPERNPLS